MALRPGDFKSPASTSCATCPSRHSSISSWAFCRQAAGRQAQPDPHSPLYTPDVTALLLLIAALSCSQTPPAPGKPLVLLPIVAETPNPDSFRRDDAFRAALMAPGKADWYEILAGARRVLLIVQKGYLTNDRIFALAEEVLAADAALPKWGGRRLITGRWTLYVYDHVFEGKETPFSEADVPGAQKGERGIELKFAKEGTAPLQHEMAHLLLGGDAESQSLSEGLADAAHDFLKPGHEHSFVPANANPEALCKAALAKYPAAFAETIGAPGYHSWSGQKIRQDFYHCSWSFARFLLKKGEPWQALAVLDRNAADCAYRKQYGAPLASLRAAWRKSL